MQRPCSHGSLSLLSCVSLDHLPRDDSLHSELDPPSSVLSQEMLDRLARSSVFSIENPFSHMTLAWSS